MAHDCDHHSRGVAKTTRRTLLFLFGLSSVYMLAEIFGGLWSGSLALLADAGHMAIDTASIGLSLFALWISQRPANREKTFGYYRAEILAALFNGATLIAVAIGIFREAWVRFSDPGAIHGEWMMGIAAGGLIVNLLGLYLTHSKDHSNLNMRSVWLHLLSDTLGSVAAVAAGFMVWRWGWTRADAVMSFVISGLILFGAWTLLQECVNVLLEGVPRGIELDEVRNLMKAIPGVNGVHDLHVWSVSAGTISLSAHVEVLDVAKYEQVLGALNSILHERFGIEHITIQIEPPEFPHAEMHA